jgi:serine protease AprX
MWKFPFLVLVLLSPFKEAFGQTFMYLVKFKDKIDSPFSINTPQAFLSIKAIERRFKQGIPIKTIDLPPNPKYIDSLKAKGADVLYKTKWFNGAVILADTSEKNAILNLPFVQGIEFNTHLKQTSNLSSFRIKNKFETNTSLDYGDASAQIGFLGVDSMHNAGFHGEGMLIAVMDNGFLNANSISCLDSTFDNNRILEVYDFVDNDRTVFGQGGHGTNVLSCMSAYVESQLIAPAFGSEYVLFRTEDDASETKAEEAFWLIAAERADSLGVDIINTSLGYSLFDNSTDNYATSEMDGNTTLITRAADFAAATGMVVVNSAGNYGNEAWQIITAPADGDSVLAIGAIDRNGIVIDFSSRGNAADGAIKPDVMAVGYQTALCTTNGAISSSNGTSFSSPLTAAMIAGLWQANPLLTSFEITDIVRKSGHIYNSPTVDYGFGYANFVRADSVAKSVYKIHCLEPTKNIKSIKISPDNLSKLVISFENNLIGKNIRLSLIDFLNKAILKQEIISISTNEQIMILPISTLNASFILRVENLTDAETLGIFKL